MAQYEEFTIDKGSDIAIEIHLTDENGNPKDLANFTAAAKLKKNFTAVNSVDFNSVVITPAEDGIVSISLTNQQTGELQTGRYVYDVEISFIDSDQNTIVERVLEGRVQVTPSVTDGVY